MCEILRIYSYVMSINELDGRWDAHASALHEWPLSDRSWEGRLLHRTTAASRSEEKREKRENLTIARDVKTWEKHVWRHLERVLKRNGAIQLHYACILYGTVLYCPKNSYYCSALYCASFKKPNLENCSKIRDKELANQYKWHGTIREESNLLF